MPLTLISTKKAHAYNVNFPLAYSRVERFADFSELGTRAQKLNGLLCYMVCVSIGLLRLINKFNRCQLPTKIGKKMLIGKEKKRLVCEKVTKKVRKRCGFRTFRFPEGRESLFT